MPTTKYIRTKDNKIIVFSELLNHSQFRFLEPISAGFISFGVGKDKNVDCSCYGKSVTLKIESIPDDTILARKQILNLDSND